MGRRRKNNKDLPQRVYQKHGAYYFVSHENKWIRLGKTKQEMYTALAQMDLVTVPCFTMRDLWKRYDEEVVPNKAISSQISNRKEIARLLSVFGDMSPDAIKPKDIAKYLDIRGKTAPVTSNHEIGLLSHMFTKAIRWGYVDNNPCRGVERNKTKPRERYVSHKELEELKKVCPELLQCYLDLKYLTGLRKTDLLMMTFDQINEEGIYVKPSKTRNSVGEARIFVWNPDLEEAVDRIRELPRPAVSKHLFVTKSGKPYIKDDYSTGAFSRMWSKVMKTALKETALTESFQERDIRAKSATDADDSGIDATELLGHGDKRVTKIYIRSKKVKKVQALRYPSTEGNQERGFDEKPD